MAENVPETSMYVLDPYMGVDCMPELPVVQAYTQILSRS